MSIEVLIKKRAPNDTFGGTFPIEAELEDLMPTEIAGLRAFGERLAKQMGNSRFRDSPETEVIGVKLLRVSFVLITQENRN